MDLRVEHIFQEELKGDTSFTEKPTTLELVFGRHNTIHQTELRETWQRGIKLGIEIGLRRASLEGQRIELTANTTDGRHKEFLEKFYKLADEYSCAIQFHPEIGMTVIDTNMNQPLW